MKELLRVLEALCQRGGTWKARRVSRQYLFDVIECTTLIQVDEGVLRGLIEVQRWDGLCRVKTEVAYYLGGRLDNKGEFKHQRHSRAKTTKLYEYSSEVLYRYSSILGISLGWKPMGNVPAEHQYLVEMAERLVAVYDRDRQTVKDKEKTAVANQKTANKTKGEQALFG